MTYKLHAPSKRYTRSSIGRWVATAAVTIGVLLLVFGAVLWQKYQNGLKPVGGSGTTSITIDKGESTSSIATRLEQARLIRSKWSFELYARFHRVSRYLQAGTYDLGPASSTQEIVAQLTHGKVATSLVTILPGQRLDQIHRALVNQGFSETDVTVALAPGQYESSPVLAGKPAGASLEGYLYPDSFTRTTTTTAKNIVEQSLAQMQKHLTPDIQNGFKAQGLTQYQGITLASIVNQEVIVQTDRAQAAQVFLKRLKLGIPLGSDASNFYGSELAGRGKDITYDSPYNTRLHAGLPPTPISNVTESALRAVAYPASTDWLFFVSGDDGTTHFSRTVAEHEALTAKYCHKLCQ